MNSHLIGAAALALSASFALADLTVPGTSNLWLAGMPDGSVAGGGVDFAPAQSPILAPVAVFGGAAFSFTVTGSVSNGPGDSGLSPDGGAIQGRSPGAENGMANLFAPINCFIGVFLAENQPDLGTTPDALDFGTLGLDVLSLSPGLQQPFFIGDGLTSGGIAQTFIAPAGATRLYLGTMDGFEWNNNSGSFSVIVIPGPGAASLAGASLLALARRRRG